MITSPQNPLIKKVAGLKLRKNRDASKLFVIEGEKFVKELPQDWEVCEFIISEAFTGEMAWYRNRGDVKIVSEAAFRIISETVTPQGVLAVVRQREYSLAELRAERGFILLCENIQDPGNLGTLLRTADAAGCDCVILSKGSVDVYNPKVLRAAAGSVFHIPVIERVEPRRVAEILASLGIRVIAALPEAGLEAHKTDFTRPCAILIGNEGRGLSEEALELTEHRVRIPMPGRAESLNASMAGGILMYEVVRQRYERGLL